MNLQLPTSAIFTRFVAALCFLLPGLAIAQLAAPPSEVEPPVASSRATEPSEGLIKLDVVVTGQSGIPVGDLVQKDFSLLDNGQPAKILSFHAFNEVTSRPNPPVEIIFVLDQLQLPASLASRGRDAVVAFLQQNGGHLAQPVSVYSLVDTGLWLLAATSTDGNALAAQVTHNHQLRLAGRLRGSARGGIPASLEFQDPPEIEALRALGNIATAARREPGRKLLLWIGPGWGVGSGAYAEGSSSHEQIFYSIRWFSTLLREARITLYSFSVGENDSHSQAYLDYLHGTQSAHDANFMHLSRKVLAVESGGLVLDKSDDLVPQIKGCVSEASAFYTLTFNPSLADHPDEYHDLRVQMSSPQLTARTNTGYYDQPFYTDQANSTPTRIAVDQLQHFVASLQPGDHDADVARQLSTLELTERLDNTTLASMIASIRGNKSRHALIVLADNSAFLSPPPSSIPSDPPPSAAEQQRILTLAADYLKTAITKSPNFFATRTTVRYEETPRFYEGDTKTEYQPLHPVESSKETMSYRNGVEVANSAKKKRNSKQPSLTTYGTFGPVLGLVRDAIAFSSDLTWSRWERSPDGLHAVFRYTVPAQRSLYQVWGCCLPDGDGQGGFQRLSGYHGQIVIDPATGVVLRMQAEADLIGFPPVTRSDVMVEYGPVDIGGKTYIRPLKSVSIMRMRSVITLSEWDESFKTYGPYTSMINDISYSDYHVFRTNSRVLPGFTPAPDEKSPDPP